MARLPVVLESMLIGFALYGLVARAAEPLVLDATQVRTLGIETVAVGGPASSDARLRSATYPARVAVPNAQMRVVTAPVAGVVERLAVAPGDRVKRGQVVAWLASPQALELQRDAMQAVSAAALQQQTLTRDEQLFAEGLIPASRVQASRAAAAQAHAQASERRQTLALAGMVPGRLGPSLALFAPLDGVVLEQGAQLGQRVDASASIYKIAKLSPLWLDIQVPWPAASGLRDGMSIKVVGIDSAGRVLSVGRAVDVASQTVPVRAEVADGAQRLIPGQSVEVEIASAGSGKAAVGVTAAVLPAAALARIDNRTKVFVRGVPQKDGGARFETREVRVLSQGGNSVQLGGVAAGELVVVNGVSALKAMVTGVGRGE